MIMGKMRSFFKKLELGFWTYGWICLLGPQVAQMWFLDPRPQGQEIFWDFIILLNSSHDSGENEVLFVKIGTRALD